MPKRVFSDHGKALRQQELNTALKAHERVVNFQGGGAQAALAGTKLDGLVLANRNLAGADFSFASLVGTIAVGSKFDHADFRCADLSNSNFSSASLLRADLRGATICHAKFVFAKLDGADLRASTVQHRGSGTARNTKFSKSMRVDFSNASLKGASFGHARLDDVNFSGAILHGASFKNVQFSNVDFTNAIITGIDLSELAVPPEALEGCVTDVSPQAAAKADMLAAKLVAHQLCIASGGATGAPAVFDGEDLRALPDLLAGGTFTGLSARNANAIGIDFSGCELQGARFDGADLRECKFSNADLRGASFRGAKLAHAEFGNANLGCLYLPNGKTLAPDFTGTDAIDSQFFNANIESNVLAPGLCVSESAGA